MSGKKKLNVCNFLKFDFQNFFSYILVILVTFSIKHNTKKIFNFMYLKLEKTEKYFTVVKTSPKI